MAHKAVRASQYLRPLQRSIELSMEIRVHSRLFLARYKGCTNARCILSRSYGHKEFKNANPFLVQKAHNAVRAGQYLVPCCAVYSVNGNSRTFATLPSSVQRLNKCKVHIIKKLWHKEFKNANPFSVQKAHKS